MSKENISKAIKIMMLFIIVILINACLSLKSEYPEIKYYQLTQNELSLLIYNDKLEGTLLIRDFHSSRQYSSEQLFIVNNENEIENYYYHRWTADISEMVTDFILSRLLQYNMFNGGVIRSSIILSPDYYLEGNIIEMAAYRAKNSDSDYVSFSINFILIRRISPTNIQPVILNKLYSSREYIPSSNLNEQASAYSKALSRISDSLFKDIFNILKK